MLVSEAVDRVKNLIQRTIREYDTNPSLKVAADGSRTPIEHPLKDMVSDDILYSIDSALKECAIRTNPLKLMVPNSSVYTEFKRVSSEFYIRIPRFPVIGEELDIDDGLAHGVIHMTIYFLYSKESRYKQIADEIYRAYNAAYRDMQIQKKLTGDDTVADAVVYFRYSSDGINFHESYVGGDIFISFKSGDQGLWSPAIRFVGRDAAEASLLELSDTPDSFDGMGGKVIAVKKTEDGFEFIDMVAGEGGGATSFVGLSDTPATLTAGKFVAVNANGDGIVLVDAPTGGATATGSGRFGVYRQAIESGFGDIEIDTENYNSFVLAPDGDATIIFKSFDDGSGTTVKCWEGMEISIMIFAASSTITLDPSQTLYGNATISPDGATLLRLRYDYETWVVVENINYPDM